MTDRSSTIGPVCPFCEKEHRPDEAFFYNEDGFEFDCDRCDKPFWVSVFRQTTWTSYTPSEMEARRT